MNALIAEHFLPALHPEDARIMYYQGYHVRHGNRIHGWGSKASDPRTRVYGSIGDAQRAARPLFREGLFICDADTGTPLLRLDTGQTPPAWVPCDEPQGATP